MQKLARLLICSAVLATVALLTPGTALAIHQKHSFHDPVTPDRTFTSQDFDKTSPGSNVHFQPTQKTEGAVCIQLVESHSRTPISRWECNKENPTSSISPTTEATAGTKFYVTLRKLDADSSNYVDALLWY
ncbi:MAG: hypothetical protein ACRDRQ_16340 [Pseudonocardiaceae bacterium]